MRIRWCEAVVKRALLPLLALLLASPVPAEPAPPFSGTYLTVEAGMLIGGELREPLPAATPAAIVVDLRNPREGTARELVRVQAAGHQYLNLPMQGYEFTPAHLDALDSLLAGRGDRPLWLHCASGKRAAVLYAAHRLRQGDDQARLAPLLTTESSREALSALAADRRPEAAP